MFWADKIAAEIEVKLSKAIHSKTGLVIRDEKTASGRVHVGSMRGVALHGILSDILSARGISNTFLYEINDFDAFDSVPPYLDSSYRKYLGRPLYALPAPKGRGNYAQYFGDQFARVIELTGFHPEFYYSYAQYKAGKYNNVIQKALESADVIRAIYKEVSGGEKVDEWLPLMVVCEKCGKVATTRATVFDGKMVHYVCDQEGSDAVGCSHEGDISPFDGNAKLPWKVEWAAKFKVFDVDIEGEGKDLATKGGARDVANRISQEVFEHEPPYDKPYEFFLIGGKRMSTSKAMGSSAHEVAALLPSKIFRLALLSRNINRAVNVDPEGDTIPALYDQYDKIADKHWNGVGDDDDRLFVLVHEMNPPEKMFLPRFSLVAFVVQMPHLDIYTELAKEKGSSLTREEKKEIDERVEYARKWLDMYADERFTYELQRNSVPEAAHAFSPEVKKLLAKLIQYIENHEELDGGALHHEIHRIRKESNVEPSALFSAIYQSFLGKENGPKAGWFLSVLNRDFLISRLKEVSV